MLPLVLACSKPSPEALHAEALRLPAEEAASFCPDIEDPGLRADCAWRVVEERAAQDYDGCAALCSTLPEGLGHECWFLLAENGDEPAACANSGDMADNCRMHLIGRRLMSLEGDFGSQEDEVEAVIIGVGLSVQDDRPWSAWYRKLHSPVRPLDRRRCDAVEDPWRREICQSSAIPLFHDRLNMARDQKLDLCGEALPPAVAYTPDPGLDDVLVQRRAADLCP